MGSKFKVGDKVKVVQGGWGVHECDIGHEVEITEVGFNNYLTGRHCYKVKGDLPATGIYTSNGVSWTSGESYELVEPAEAKKPILTLKYDGLSIDLDPNIPFSRKIAEAFLDVAYLEGV